VHGLPESARFNTPTFPDTTKALGGCHCGAGTGAM
jgi:hypothetical protein